jgi:hypothetical protein
MRHLTLSRHRAALLGARARALREFSTVSERKLWVELSAGKAGVSFRRQVPLAGRWIADTWLRRSACRGSRWLHSRAHTALTRVGMKSSGGSATTCSGSRRSSCSAICRALSRASSRRWRGLFGEASTWMRLLKYSHGDVLPSLRSERTRPHMPPTNLSKPSVACFV